MVAANYVWPLTCNFHHQPINVCWGTDFPYALHIRRTFHIPRSRPSLNWWVPTISNAAGTNGLACLTKHGGVRDNKFLFIIRWLTNVAWLVRSNAERTDRAAIQLAHLLTSESERTLEIPDKLGWRHHIRRGLCSRFYGWPRIARVDSILLDNIV
jgi:hypothetical protein